MLIQILIRYNDVYKVRLGHIILFKSDMRKLNVGKNLTFKNAVVVTCWEMANDLIGSLMCDVLLCFVTFSCGALDGALGQVWYLIVSIPDSCVLKYGKY